MEEQKKKIINFRVTEDELKDWKEAALDQRYANFSQFIRDAIEEKIEIWRENQGDFEYE